MRLLISAAALLAAGVAVAGAAQASEDLAKKYNCLACHHVSNKSVGPTYKAIAAKYKGQADAVAKLSDKVKKGGSGVWGPVPMAPNPSVPDADLKTLVEWVMKQ